MAAIHGKTERMRFYLPLAFVTAVMALLCFEHTSGIAIRAFRQRTKVNGVNCSTVTALAAAGCYCRLNGQRCLGNLRCINNVCVCGPGFVNTTLGTCLAQNVISVTSVFNPAGFPNCNPAVTQRIPGLIINGPKPASCIPVVTNSVTIPVNVALYNDPVNSYISVDAITGQVFFNGGPTLPAGFPCGPIINGGSLPPGTVITTDGQVVQTYAVNCVDSRGVVSNPLSFNVTWPSCRVAAACS